jgi:hypothetical protein
MTLIVGASRTSDPVGYGTEAFSDRARRLDARLLELSRALGVLRTLWEHETRVAGSYPPQTLPPRTVEKLAAIAHRAQRVAEEYHRVGDERSRLPRRG